MSFVLKQLTIQRKNMYASRVEQLGALEGQLTLMNEAKSNITLQLTEQQTQKIMVVIAEALVDTTKELASIMTTEVIEQATNGLALGSSLS